MRIDRQSAAFCCANQQRAHKSFGASLRARREHVTALGVEGRYNAKKKPGTLWAPCSPASGSRCRGYVDRGKASGLGAVEILGFGF